MRIPLARPSFDARELMRLKGVLDSGWVVQGPNVAAFEQRLCDLHEVRHAVAVSNGTAALHLVELALGIGPGDSVIIPSFAWPSAANVTALLGAQPLLIDVRADTYNLDVNALRASIEQASRTDRSKPRAIVAVHEFGLAADMAAIEAIADESGLDVIEDAACALGARHAGRAVGSIGRCGVLSFHPRKAVTTGEGGAVLTNDAELADQVRELRNHGQSSSGRHAFARAGLNYRLTDLQGALGLAQLEKLPEILSARRRIAERFLEQLAAVPGVRLPADSAEHTWQTFMVVLDGKPRAQVIAALAAQGIASGAGSVAAHCLGVYRDGFGYGPDDLPVSRLLHEQGLALPLFAGLTSAEVDEVCAALTAALR